MKKSPIYLIYGTALLLAFSTAQYRGYGLMGPTAKQYGPKTIRDNPGASRAHYGNVPRYVGGK